MSAAVAFGPTANPDAYVPWSGSERALDALVRWARAPAAPIRLLLGPPGMGKTLLLRLLATRTDDELRSCHLAYPDCNPAALCTFLLQELGGAARDATPEALLTALQAGGEPPALLLVDEGELLPLATARWIRDIATRAEGRLRVVIALTRDERGAELASTFGDAADTVRIEGSMSKAEVATHVRTQLERAAVDPGLGARFDHATLARLHARSEGVPASLQSLAAGLLFDAQRERGEIGFARSEAPPELRGIRAEPSKGLDSAVPTSPPAMATIAAAPPESAHRRVPGFALGAALGIAAGIAVGVFFAPRLLESPQRATAVQSLREVAPTPPPVAAAPPPAPIVAAPPPVLVAPAPPAPTPAAPLPPPVAVSFNSDPWAYIEVDGQRIGVTPIAAHPVTPGRHRVVANLVDGRVIERELEIDAERNRRVVFP